MSRIVVTTIGSFGDLHPKIALALELRKRGHEIIFATHKEYRDKIEALGFDFRRLRPDNTAMDDPEEMARMMDLTNGTEYVIKHWVGASLRDTYTDLRDSARDADLIIAGEGVMPARLVSEKFGIPWLSIVLQPASFLSVHDPSVIPLFPSLAKFRGLGSIVTRGILALSRVVSRSWAEPIHQLRDELGLPPLAGNPFIDDKYSPYLVLALFSTAFARSQPDWPPNALATGFAFYDGSDDATELPPRLQRFLDAPEAPIVFTLGSAAVMAPGNFFPESIRAARLLNRLAVLLVGKNAPPENLPEGIVAIPYAPYSRIFPHASAIVHQGGIGTTAQALRAGRPTLVMPYCHDQPDNAARLERLGTSRTIARERYSAERVARQIEKLLNNPDYGKKAEEIAGIIRSENGVGAACDAIEKQLQEFGNRAGRSN